MAHSTFTKRILNFTGMLVFILLVILLLASLLTVFKAPTYHLWLLAIAVSEFPLIFAGITGVLLLTGFWVHKYQPASTIAGILALALFLSPIARAYIIASSITPNFNGAFGPGSTIMDGSNNHAPFCLYNMVTSANKKQVTYKTSLTAKPPTIYRLIFTPLSLPVKSLV
jgi:hypothetical protein